VSPCRALEWRLLSLPSRPPFRFRHRHAVRLRPPHRACQATVAVGQLGCDGDNSRCRPAAPGHRVDVNRADRQSARHHRIRPPRACPKGSGGGKGAPIARPRTSAQLSRARPVGALRSAGDNRRSCPWRPRAGCEKDVPLPMGPWTSLPDRDRQSAGLPLSSRLQHRVVS